MKDLKYFLNTKLLNEDSGPRMMTPEESARVIRRNEDVKKLAAKINQYGGKDLNTLTPQQKSELDFAKFLLKNETEKGDARFVDDVRREMGENAPKLDSVLSIDTQQLRSQIKSDYARKAEEDRREYEALKLETRKTQRISGTEMTYGQFKELTGQEYDYGSREHQNLVRGLASSFGDRFADQPRWDPNKPAKEQVGGIGELRTNVLKYASGDEKAGEAIGTGKLSTSLRGVGYDSPDGRLLSPGQRASLQKMEDETAKASYKPYTPPLEDVAKEIGIPSSELLSKSEYARKMYPPATPTSKVATTSPTAAPSTTLSTPARPFEPKLVKPRIPTQVARGADALAQAAISVSGDVSTGVGRQLEKSLPAAEPLQSMRIRPVMPTKYIVPESQEWEQLSDEEKTNMAIMALQKDEAHKLFGGREKKEGGFLGIGAKRTFRFSEDNSGNTPGEIAYLNRVAKMLNSLLDKQDIKAKAQQAEIPPMAEPVAPASRATIPSKEMQAQRQQVQTMAAQLPVAPVAPPVVQKKFDKYSKMPFNATAMLNRLSKQKGQYSTYAERTLDLPLQIPQQNIDVNSEFDRVFGPEMKNLPTAAKQQMLDNLKQQKPEEYDWSKVSPAETFARAASQRAVADEFRKRTGRDIQGGLRQGDTRLINLIKASQQRAR